MGSVGDLMQADFGGPWGLRGDPILWDTLRQNLSETPQPHTVPDLRTILEAAFLSATAHELTNSDACIAVQNLRRPNGGMSNGMVSPEFWRDVGFPVIEKAYLNQAGAA